jgi:2-oxoisovalerate dehydrogenase E1 component beta subunit
MAKMNMLQAINSALSIAMEENKRSCVFGEDVGYFGGVFRATSGLQEKFGKERVFNTPLVEQGILGFANGLAF